MTEDKKAAYTTLYTVLTTFAKLTAPFTPFIAENIYGNLVPQFYKDAPKSVHLCKFPEFDQSLIDLKLEADMEAIESMVVLGRAARNLSNIKNRQPLQKLYFSVGGNIELSDQMYQIARDELNVKEFEVLTDSSDFITYKLKPQLKTLGPKYGKKLGLIKQFLETCNANEVVKTVRQGNPYKVELGGEEVVFEESDLLIATESREGFISASENGNTVVLDVNLTKELIDEGLVREIVSRVQTMRKEADFKVTDRINLYYTAEGQIARIFKEYGDRIAKATLTANISEGKAEGYQKDWELNEEAITLTVQKVGQ